MRYLCPICRAEQERVGIDLEAAAESLWTILCSQCHEAFRIGGTSEASPSLPWKRRAVGVRDVVILTLRSASARRPEGDTARFFRLDSVITRDGELVADGESTR